MKKSEEYAKGYKAYLEKKSYNSNPYEWVDLYKARLWDEGYNDARTYERRGQRHQCCEET